MSEYGICANNNETVYCHWCKEPVKAGERTIEIGMIGFYGHVYCFYLSRKGLTKQQIRERYLMKIQKQGGRR